MLLLEKLQQQKNELNEQLLTKEQELTLLRNQFEESVGSTEKVNRIEDLENQVCSFPLRFSLLVFFG